MLKDVIEKDGAFDYLSWKICTSGSCEDKHSTWGWLGGMNNEGTSMVEREGINITSDGALEIKSIRLSDGGHYMCTVKRILHMSPKRHFVTLIVNTVGKLKLSRSVTCVVLYNQKSQQCSNPVD